MNKKISVAILILIVIIFGVAAFFANQKSKNTDFSTDRQDAINDIISRPQITLTAKHQYKNGQHNFVGTFEVPSPCYEDKTEVIKKPDNSTEIAITFSEKNNSELVCAQVITERQFKVSFAGNEDDEIFASINGEIVNFNLFEIDSDENIDDAEIYIKG